MGHSASMKRHAAVLVAILALTSLLYAGVTSSYFCGYDDFLDVQRAELVDQIHPAKIFTTTHYDSFKYRPLQRLSNLLSYLAAPKEAIGFRLRNLFFHELCVVAIYCLGLLLFDSWILAGVAAGFFAVHPLVNQPILQAVGGNPLANFLFLLGLDLFLLSEKRRSGPLLCLSLFCGSVALYGYEASIVLPGIMLSWWGIVYLRTKRLPDRRTIALFVLVGGLFFGSYLLVRQHCGAVLLPVDVVLAHDWFGTPLPSQIDVRRFATLFLGPALAVVVLIGIFAVKYRTAIANLLPREEWDKLLFLSLAALFCIFPFLVFTDHVSETYITLPVAFYCLVLSRLLALIPWPTTKWMAVGALAILLCSATWVRNQKVSACASNAKQILSNLSFPAFRQGEWRINLAKAPGQITLPRYGLYNYAGLDTIGTGAGGTEEYGLHGVESALQIATGNPKLRVRVLPTSELPGQCRQLAANEVCYFVNADNTVAPLK
jgi:hypothetical protein